MLKDFLLPRDVISDYCGGLSTQLCWNPELLSTYRMYVLVFPNLSLTLERLFVFLEENISFWLGFVAALFANAPGKKKHGVRIHMNMVFYVTSLLYFYKGKSIL